MSLFSVLGINAHTLSSFQKGIDLTNKNINNLNNKDYARERPIYNELPGYGVTMSEARRVYDQRYFDRYIKENQNFNYYQEYSSSLDTVENIFNDIHGSGFAQDINEYYTALNDIVSEPENLAARDTFLEKSKVLISKMQQSYEALESEKSNLQMSMQQEVQDINSLTKELAAVNKEIAAQPKSLIPEQERLNTLLNQRDKIIKELSNHIDLKVRYNSNNTTDVFSAKGHALVVSDKSFDLSIRNESKDLGFGLTTQSSKLYLNGVDLSDDFSKGTLSAKLDTQTFIEEKMGSLNTLANTFATQNNAQHKQGFDLNSNQGKALFLNSETNDETNINIKNITLAINDPKEIAASSTQDGIPSNNENAKALYELKEKSLSTLDNKTFYNYYIDMVASIGSKKRSMEAMAQDSEQMRNALDAKIQESSGVNLDEELTNLMQLQRSYEAAARVLNVTDKLLETVMDIVR